MADWIKFNGSEEHKEMMRNSVHGWECRMKNGDVFKDLLNYRHIPFSEISEFMIYEPHPHKDMIIEWANTGRPVYFKDHRGRWEQLVSGPAGWYTDKEYSFDPPKYRLKYRKALIACNGEFFIDIAREDSDINKMTKKYGFIKWIDNDWQEVEA